MTTAARPTFDTARGGTSKGENDLSALSKQYSSRDLPSHTKLKYRCVCSMLLLRLLQSFHDHIIDDTVFSQYFDSDEDNCIRES